MTDTLPRDIEAGSSPDRPIRRWLRKARAWVDTHRYLRLFYRLGVAVLGTAVTVAGLILVPLPGPGWLIVFLGIGILGTEFPAAHRVNAFLKRTLMRFWNWFRARRAQRAETRAASRAAAES